MARVQSGDEGALGTLMERWRSRLFAFLLRRIGNEATAEDLFQETWLRVVKAKDSFDTSRRFSTWMFQIANNLCRDRGRRRGVEERHMDTLRETARHDPQQHAPPPLDLKLDVHRRVARLPDPLREVILLRYFHQLPEREIAAVVGIPPGTVKSRLHTAVRRLRSQDMEENA